MNNEMKARYNKDITLVSPRFNTLWKLVKWIQNKYKRTVIGYGPNCNGWPTLALEGNLYIEYERNEDFGHPLQFMTYSPPRHIYIVTIKDWDHIPHETYVIDRLGRYADDPNAKLYTQVCRPLQKEDLTK